MTFWPNAEMQSFHPDSESVRWPCEVRIEKGQIVVSYDDDDGPVVYSGQEVEPGHFILDCPRKRGRASLHKFKDAKRLDGSWVEDGYHGMWQIELGG